MEPKKNIWQWCDVKYLAIAVPIVSILIALLTKSSLYTALFVKTSSDDLFTSKPFIYIALFILQIIEYAILLHQGWNNGFVGPLKHLFTCSCNHGDRIKTVTVVIVLTIIIVVVLVLSALGLNDYTIYGFISQYDDISSMILFRTSHSVHLVFDITMWLYVTGLALGYMKEWDVTEIDKVSTLYECENLYKRKGDATMATRKTLRTWFVVHYMIFVVYVCATFRDIVKPFLCQSSRPRHYPNNLYSLGMYFLYDSLSCIFPFALGLLMNLAHGNFYRKILEAFEKKHQQVNSKLSSPSASKETGDQREENTINNPSSPPMNGELSPPLLFKDYEFVPKLFSSRWPLEGNVCVCNNYLWVAIPVAMACIVSIPLL